jgi:hypothetical protein
MHRHRRRRAGAGERGLRVRDEKDRNRRHPDQTFGGASDPGPRSHQALLIVGIVIVIHDGLIIARRPHSGSVSTAIGERRMIWVATLPLSTRATKPRPRVPIAIMSA